MMRVEELGPFLVIFERVSCANSVPKSKDLPISKIKSTLESSDKTLSLSGKYCEWGDLDPYLI